MEAETRSIEEQTEPCGECGRPISRWGEGVCYQCQCELHAAGAIDMDNDPWRGPVDPAPRYDYGEYDCEREAPGPHAPPTPWQRHQMPDPSSEEIPF